MSTATATASAALPELTLIVAATQQMGIGRHGTLPWTGLRREMAYFARVTKRLPPLSLSPPPSSSSSPSSSSAGAAAAPPPVVQNAVIMGRKTWESIPERFRPLPGRLNVVVSRSAAAGGAGAGAGAAAGVAGGGAVLAGSLEEALRYLKGVRDDEGRAQGKGGPGLGRVFVIGGGQIYDAALKLGEARRVLLTRVRSEFECDTFFPVRLEEGQGKEAGWRRSGQEEMDGWVGEEVPRGVQSEAGTEYEFEMWERVD